MPEKPIEAVLGVGTTQTATEFIINKPGLAQLLTSAGYTFTPTDTNSLDELMTAILCAGLVGMTPTDRDADPLTRNVEFRYDESLNFDTIVSNGNTYNRHTIESTLYKKIDTPKINPSDFKN